MPTHSNNLNQCSFIGYKGLCGRRCYRDVCAFHHGKKPMTICKHCGIKGTTTPHGFCAAVSTGCLWRAHYASRLLKDERDGMGDFIDEILSWDWENFVYKAPPCAPEPRASAKVPRAVTTAILQRALSDATLALAALKDNSET